jgi:hypothetical protein
MSITKIQRRVQVSSMLVLLGLFVELVSLVWSHPTAFVLFVIPGALLMAAGAVVYLYSLVSVSESNEES